MKVVREVNCVHRPQKIFLVLISVTALQIGRSLVRSQMVFLEIFIDINPSDRSMALGSTKTLTEMSTRRISWG
jgi:hypothetical protein